MVNLEENVMFVTFGEDSEGMITQVLISPCQDNDCPIGYDMIIFHGAMEGGIDPDDDGVITQQNVEVDKTITEIAPAVMVHFHDVEQVDFFLRILIKMRKEMLARTSDSF